MMMVNIDAVAEFIVDGIITSVTLSKTAFIITNTYYVDQNSISKIQVLLHAISWSYNIVRQSVNTKHIIDSSDD
jgi:hypothetical protein